MSYNYSNYTQFGMKNVTERYAYAVWSIFVVICSLLGDTTILVASIKYKAFKLNKIVLTFIQHMAACDLLNSMESLLPTAVSVICNGGGSSSTLNLVRFLFFYHVNTASPAFVAAMTLAKLLVLRYPLRARSWLKRRAHKVCAGIWLASFYAPAVHLLVDKDDVIFDYRLYVCSYQYTKSIWKTLLPVIAILSSLTPTITIIVSTVLILKKAKRAVKEAHQSLRWQGIMTVVLTATVYSVSYLPITVYFMAESLAETYPSAPGTFFTEFYKVAGSVAYCNVLANFFVYSLTVDSFRSFLKKVFETAASIPFLIVFFQGSVSL